MPQTYNLINEIYLLEKDTKNMKLKQEYKTAVIGGFLGKQHFEMLLCPESLYPLIAKDFPHFFEEEVFDGMAKTIETKKETKSDISKSEPKQ